MCAALTSPTETYPVSKDQYLDIRVPAQDKPPTLESAYDELVPSGQRVFRRQGLTVPLLITFLTAGGAATGSAAASSTRLIDAPNLIAHVVKLNSGHGTVTFPSATIEQDDRVNHELAQIRALTGLSVNDMARLCGIKRRHVYNLLDGGETEPHRAANIRRIAAVIEGWSHRFQRPEALRSALLAPLDGRQRDFITLASSSNEPNAIATAADLFEGYMQRLGNANPVVRMGVSSVTGRREAAEQLRDLYGENNAPTGA